MPVKEAIWINGSMWCCDTPSKSQGNPPRIRASTISHATHAAALESAHTARRTQLLAKTPPNFSPSSSSCSTLGVVYFSCGAKS